mgnify:CR=1 FL=1
METLSDQIDREIGTQIRQTLSREWLRWLAGRTAICRMTRIIQTRKIGSKISGK